MNILKSIFEFNEYSASPQEQITKAIILYI